MKPVFLAFLVLLAQPVWSADLETELSAIQHRWAEIQYQMPDDQKEKAFEVLAGEAEDFVAHYPDRAEPLIWQGIVLSTYAGAKGGLGALGLVKDARKSLEAALAINPEGLDANFFFGDFLLDQGEPERARAYLQKVLDAPGRPGREVADAGRRAEARERLETL